MHESSSQVKKREVACVEKSTTPWKSIYLDTGMQTVLGIQAGIYMLITWPYFTEIDNSATTTFLGLVISATSVGGAILNPLYGLWTEKTLSTKHPSIVGFSIALAGNLLYILAQHFPPAYIKWVLLASRFLIGCGAGCLTSLQAYICTASTGEDRLKAVSYGSAGYSLGVMLGPAVPSLFTLLPPSLLPLSIYTLSSITMMIMCVVCIALLLFAFHEHHAGILAEDENDASFSSLASPDLLALAICFYCYFLVLGIETGNESMQAPLTMALYDWSNEEAVRYNGALVAVSSAGDLLTFAALTHTRLGRIDRRTQILIGLSAFALFYILHTPWPFYQAIEFNPFHNGTSAYTGEKCYERYPWCASSTRLPLPLYLSIFLLFLPLGFPLVLAPVNTLVSEIVGPRRQGLWQGCLTLAGSLGQLSAPAITAAVFDHTGYLWITTVSFGLCIFGISLFALYYTRLVPLKVTREERSPSTVLQQTVTIRVTKETD